MTIARNRGPGVATFSMAAWDPETVCLDVAAQCRFLAVGSVAPWAEAALVTAFFANEAAAGLYRSEGFRTVGREHLYGKNL